MLYNMPVSYIQRHSKQGRQPDWRFNPSHACKCSKFYQKDVAMQSARASRETHQSKRLIWRDLYSLMTYLTCRLVLQCIPSFHPSNIVETSLNILCLWKDHSIILHIEGWKDGRQFLPHHPLTVEWTCLNWKYIQWQRGGQVHSLRGW